VDFATGGSKGGAGLWVSVGNDDNAWSNGEDVAAQRGEFVIGQGDRANVQLVEQDGEARWQQGPVNECEIVGDWRDDAQQMKHF
jgi:hypothetical protein